MPQLNTRDMHAYDLLRETYRSNNDKANDRIKERRNMRKHEDRTSDTAKTKTPFEL